MFLCKLLRSVFGTLLCKGGTLTIIFEIASMWAGYSDLGFREVLTGRKKAMGAAVLGISILAEIESHIDLGLIGIHFIRTVSQ